MVTKEQVLKALKFVQYAGMQKNIVDYGFVKDLEVDESGKVTFRVAFTTNQKEIEEPLKKMILENLTDEGITNVKVTMDITIADAPKPPSKPQQAQTPQTPGPIDKDPNMIPQVRNTLLVSSAKGGVGKSTVSLNLALALAKKGMKVGLLDSDIYGPSLPIMTGLEGKQPKSDGQKIEPLEKFGIKLMSIGFLVSKDDALIWRGPMIMQAVQQLLKDVNWGDLDYLVIDLPPGTGDTQLTFAQKLNISGAIIVTTPQDVALIDTVRGIDMFNKTNVPIIGLIENMSYFLCPSCGNKDEIFSSQGAKKQSKELNIPFLGEIPLNLEVREGGDNGEPVVIGKPESEISKVFLSCADKVIEVLPKDGKAPKKGILSKMKSLLN